jgi:hypothetical protein
VFVKKYNEKAKTNKAKVATVSKAGIAHVPRKRANGGSSDQASKKGHSVKYCCWCKANRGPLTTHDMVEYCKYEKNGSLKDKSAKPINSSKKPW